MAYPADELLSSVDTVFEDTLGALLSRDSDLVVVDTVQSQAARSAACSR
jgi:hypothetical protein